jgi:hypothetical protein
MAAAVLLLGELPAAQAQYPYYERNTWYNYSGPSGRFYYAHYYYAPRVYHHAYYYPYVSTRYVYYYSVTTRRYWGRYDMKSKKYSLLPKDKRKEKLEDIKEKDFPEPKPLDKVVIPGSKKTMTPPPPLPKGA